MALLLFQALPEGLPASVEPAQVGAALGVPPEGGLWPCRAVGLCPWAEGRCALRGEGGWLWGVGSGWAGRGGSLLGVPRGSWGGGKRLLGACPRFGELLWLK